MAKKIKSAAKKVRFRLLKIWSAIISLFISGATTQACMYGPPVMYGPPTIP